MLNRLVGVQLIVYLRTFNPAVRVASGDINLSGHSVEGFKLIPMYELVHESMYRFNVQTNTLLSDAHCGVTMVRMV